MIYDIEYFYIYRGNTVVISLQRNKDMYTLLNEQMNFPAIGLDRVTYFSSFEPLRVLCTVNTRYPKLMAKHSLSGHLGSL